MSGVRFLTTDDDVSLAWRRAGSGPPLVKAATWLTHLDADYDSPVWAHQTAFYEQHFDYLRYDERGCGLSDHETGKLDLDTWVSDLRAVIEDADMPRPFTLLGQSQGAATAVAYAARYPGDVGLLVLAGGFTRGTDHRDDPKAAALFHAVIEVFRQGFDDDNPAFREVFTSRFVPDGDAERTRWFSDLCRRSTTPETGARLLKARAAADASRYLAQVTCPTLVFHAEGDLVVPISEGRHIARHIAGAEFIRLASSNHIFQGEPAWDAYTRLLLERTGRAHTADFGLTARESEILDLICQARSNKDIARTLEMSEKTVRNHATHIFAKLGVANRQEAILKVRGATP